MKVTDQQKCKYCGGTGKAYSTVLKEYVVCDACKGTGYYSGI